MSSDSLLSNQSRRFQTFLCFLPKTLLCLVGQVYIIWLIMSWQQLTTWLTCSPISLVLRLLIYRLTAVHTSCWELVSFASVSLHCYCTFLYRPARPSGPAWNRFRPHPLYQLHFPRVAEYINSIVPLPIRSAWIGTTYERWPRSVRNQSTCQCKQ